MDQIDQDRDAFDDEAEFTLFVDSTGLDKVIEHLSLQAVARQEDWSGALVGRGRVYVTSAAYPELRRPAYYEACFDGHQVLKEFRDEENMLRERLRRGADLYFGYYVNLDERGSFRADVRNAEGASVFEVLGGNELGEDDSSLVEDGFMSSFHDYSGLRDHLLSIGILPAGAELRSANEHEALIDLFTSQLVADPRCGEPDFPSAAPDVDQIRAGVLEQLRERRQAQRMR